MSNVNINVVKGSTLQLSLPWLPSDLWTQHTLAWQYTFHLQDSSCTGSGSHHPESESDSKAKNIFTNCQWQWQWLRLIQTMIRRLLFIFKALGLQPTLPRSPSLVHTPVKHTKGPPNSRSHFPPAEPHATSFSSFTKSSLDSPACSSLKHRKYSLRFSW